MQRREQGRQHGGEHAHRSRLGGVHDGRELCAEAAQQSGAAWQRGSTRPPNRLRHPLQPQERSHLSKSNASRQLDAVGQLFPHGSSVQSSLCPSFALPCPARKSPRRNKQLHVKEAVEGRTKTALAFHDARTEAQREALLCGRDKRLNWSASRPASPDAVSHVWRPAAIRSIAKDCCEHAFGPSFDASCSPHLTPSPRLWRAP